ncbi:MAG: hypothetical protein CK425_05885 [Parachlamydia sp.]|nr:MAG: hypothetical protein CK425_05885 [Parachlamydia sp.]
MYRFVAIPFLFWFLLALAATLALMSLLFVKNSLTFFSMTRIKQKTSKISICQPKPYKGQD